VLFEVSEDDMVGNNEDEAGAVTDDTVSAGGKACWVRVDELRPVAKEVGSEEYERYSSSSSFSNKLWGENMNDFDDGMSSGNATNLTIFRPQ